MNIKIALCASLAGGALLGTASAARAGFVLDSPVSFFSEYKGGPLGARGSLRSVRNSADSEQYIGCSIYAYATGGTYRICYAKKATGEYRSCETTIDSQMRVIDSLNAASHLQFIIRPDGSCKQVAVTTESTNL